MDIQSKSDSAGENGFPASERTVQGDNTSCFKKGGKFRTQTASFLFRTTPFGSKRTLVQGKFPLRSRFLMKPFNDCLIGRTGYSRFFGRVISISFVPPGVVS